MLGDLIKAYKQAFFLFLRTKTRPLTIEEAEEKKLLWAKIYAAVGFTTLMTCTFVTYKSNYNFSYRTDIPKDRAVVEKLALEPTKVVVYKGFKKIDEYQFTPPKKDTSTD